MGSLPFSQFTQFSCYAFVLAATTSCRRYGLWHCAFFFFSFTHQEVEEWKNILILMQDSDFALAISIKLDAREWFYHFVNAFSMRWKAKKCHEMNCSGCTANVMRRPLMQNYFFCWICFANMLQLFIYSKPLTCVVCVCNRALARRANWLTAYHLCELNM